MPLTRDLVSLALLVVVVLVIMLAHLQWKRMRSGIPALLDSGAFKTNGASLAALGERVRNANTWFGRFGKYWWIFMWWQPL